MGGVRIPIRGVPLPLPMIIGITNDTEAFFVLSFWLFSGLRTPATQALDKNFSQPQGTFTVGRGGVRGHP